MNLPAVLERPLTSLDALRGRALACLGPRAPRLLRDRERRVAAYGLLAIALAFGLTFAAPMVLLAIGPVVLGAPHLVADVRYLVVRPGLHRRPELWLFVAGPACAAFLYPHAWVSLSAVAFAAFAARAPALRRTAVGLAALAVVVLAAQYERAADLLIAHAHNAVAVALFCVWSRRRGRLHWLVAASFVLGVVAIGLGAFDQGPFARLAASRLYDADLLTATLAPLADPVLATRAILVFAFAQSVHYAVWVRLVPEEDRPRPGLRSFASSLRALVLDLGGPLALLAGLCTLGIALWALVSVVDARDGYLRLAVFHGPLELGAAGVLLLERGRVRVAAGS